MAISFHDKIVIHTDGACSGNPGPGGWGAIVVFPDGHVRELGGAQNPTTNNKMELEAVIAALHFVRAAPQDVLVFADSTYVIRGITQWIWGWMKRGWRNSQDEPVANTDQWKELFKIVEARGRQKIQWHYVRGHQGTPGNERCDEIAVGFSKNQWVDLYDGDLLKYAWNPHDIPEDTRLPEMKPTTAKAAAYSYVSVVNGQPQRHSTWAECERRVKGVSGAKFKKTMSADNEAEILASWGFDPF
jgi:ribonuclease HI